MSCLICNELLHHHIITCGLISCVSHINTISPPKLSFNYQNQTRTFHGRQTARTPDAEHRTHSGASGAHLRHRHQTGRSGPAFGAANTSVRCCQHQRPVSVSQREILPQLLQISHRRNRKYTLNFLKSAESCLASSTGGREEPKPLSTLGTPPPL